MSQDWLVLTSPVGFTGGHKRWPVALYWDCLLGSGLAHPPCQSDGGGVQPAPRNQMKPAVRPSRRAPIHRCAAPGYLCPVLQIRDQDRTTQGCMLQAARRQTTRSEVRGRTAGSGVRQGQEGGSDFRGNRSTHKAGRQGDIPHTSTLRPGTQWVTLGHPVGDPRAPSG